MEATEMIVKQLNRLTGQVNEMELDITDEQISAFEKGAFVQDAFPNLTPTEREFILTGMTEAEQKEIFG
jgi:uncharacterized protein YdeI (YjbR/CyaY-like superfamily)